MGETNLESREIEINGLESIAKRLILKGDYTRAFDYLYKLNNLLSRPENYQEYIKWKDTSSSKKAERVRAVIDDITGYESEKNRIESSKEDHLEAYRKCEGVCGAEAAAEWISAQSAPTRVELDISKRERLSKLEASIENYAKSE